MLSNNTNPLQPSRPAPASPTYTPFSLKKKTMSVTQTYYLAHKARSKLSREASRSDHNLRLLVGHANLLDCLMLELADAEREQESWFNQSVRGASKHDVEDAQQQQTIEYEDTIIEVPEDDDQWDSDSDSDSSDEEFESQADDEDVEMADAVSLRRIPTPHIILPHMHTSRNMDEDDYAILDDDDEDDDEDYAELGLVRTVSHTTPPELDDDSDTSEDETMPPSPPTAVLTFSDKEQKEIQQQQQQQQQEEETFYNTGFYLPARNPARMVTAI